MKDLSSAEMIYLGAALALQIAEGMDTGELAVYAALYTTIGDQLSLILAKRPQ